MKGGATGNNLLSGSFALALGNLLAVALTVQANFLSPRNRIQDF